MRIDRDAVLRVIGLLGEFGVGEIEVREGDTTVRVRRSRGAGSGPPAAGPTEEAPAVGEETLAAPAQEPVEALAGRIEHVTAGLVGLFHHGRTPGDEPIVQVGDEVAEGQVIGTIEALRKLTDVVATAAGVIDEVLVDDGAPVQYGDELFAIRVEEA